MTTSRLHVLAERLSSLMRASLRQSAAEYELKLAQLEALIYLSMANRYSDTPIALTEYLGVTKGTTSQTLKALERHGYVEKRPDPSDGRVVHCSLTSDGRRVVAAAYPAGCFSQTSDTQASQFADALEVQLRSLQRANGAKTFGQCLTCSHYEARARGGRCGLTGEALSNADGLKICREHEVAPPGA